MAPFLLLSILSFFIRANSHFNEKEYICFSPYLSENQQINVCSLQVNPVYYINNQQDTSFENSK